MKRIFLLLCCSACLCMGAQAQINNYIRDTWSEKGHLTPITPVMGNQPMFIIASQIIARDFNITNTLKYAGVAHLKTVYKKIHINTTAGADSLTQLILAVREGEAFHSLRARVLYPDGRSNLPRMEQAVMQNGQTAILIPTPDLQAGSQVEYDMTTRVFGDYNGVDQLQADNHCQQAIFILKAPAGMEFRTHVNNSDTQLTAVEENNVRVQVGTYDNIPPASTSRLYFPVPHLLSVSFALYKEEKQATPITWQKWGEQTYAQYLSTDRQEIKSLERELNKWTFLQRRTPLPALIYQVEHFLKTQFPITPAANERPDDFSNMLRAKATTPTGMIRLMASVYYALGIRCHLVFTGSRDETPIDSSLVIPKLADNVLLYFPDTRLALAPAEADYRYPYIPPTWGNIPGIRSRDTLINDKNEIRTDIITTPLPDYTRNSMTLDATLQLNAAADSVQCQSTQAFGGYLATTLRQMVAQPNGGGKEAIFRSLLPLPRAFSNIQSQEGTQESWTMGNMNEPFTLRSQAAAKMVAYKGTQLLVNIGHLLTHQSIQSDLALPPQGLPMEISFPYYLERRVTFTIPKGYKLANLADLNKDLYYEEGGKKLLGYKINSRIEDGQLHIYAMEWYQQLVLNGKAKETYRQIMQLVAAQERSVLVLEKG